MAESAQTPLYPSWALEKEKQLEELKEIIESLENALEHSITSKKKKDKEIKSLKEREKQIIDSSSIEKENLRAHLQQEQEKNKCIIENLKTEQKQLQSKMQIILQEREDLQEQIKNKMSEVYCLQKELGQKQGQLLTSAQEKQHLREQLKNQTRKIEELNLSQEKSTISELACPKRPTRIGERWTSLFLDEWKLTYVDFSDRKIYISPEKQLLNIVDWCYRHCKQLLCNQDTKIREFLCEVVRQIHFLGDTSRPECSKSNDRTKDYSETDIKITTNGLECLLENAVNQRLSSTSLVDAAIKISLNDYKKLHSHALQNELKFVQKCSELCWYICCSDPQMVIEYENFTEKPFDANKFNAYNRTGAIVEYVVWPALLLHKDGQVLAKGTVQTNAGSETFLPHKIRETQSDQDKKPNVPEDSKGNTDGWKQTHVEEFKASVEDFLKSPEDETKDKELRSFSRSLSANVKEDRPFLYRRASYDVLSTKEERRPFCRQKSEDVLDSKRKNETNPDGNNKYEGTFKDESLQEVDKTDKKVNIAKDTEKSQLKNTKYYVKSDKEGTKHPDTLKRNFEKVVNVTSIPPNLKQLSKDKPRSRLPDNISDI